MQRLPARAAVSARSRGSRLARIRQSAYYVVMTDQLDHRDHDPSPQRTMPCSDGTFCYRPTDTHYRFAVVADGFEFDGRTFRRQVDVLDYIDETHEPKPEPQRTIAGRISAGRGPTPLYDDLMRSVFGW